jgi:hypothetical protein
VFSLTPGFSPVQRIGKGKTVLTVSHHEKAVETARFSRRFTHPAEAEY